MPIQNLFDRGGPPQTGWSSRREQQDHAELARSLVELSFQIFQTLRVHLRERRLAPGRLMREDATSHGRSQKHYRYADGNSTAAGHPGNRSASRLATTWGISIMTSTSAAHTQKTATLSRLRRWHVAPLLR